ncbi:MAG: class I SAM-dependent methyltransferase family protein [Candidatus Undinarchaeales archaeon]
MVEHKTDKKKNLPGDFTELLEEKLSKKELDILRSSHDVLGNIAVIEIPDELESREKEIGEALLNFYPNVRAVFKKAGPVETEFRVLPLKKIAGIGGTEVEYKESGCRFKFDFSKVFFTQRLGTERLRIAKKVKPNETIVDMFAGVGPFSIIIAKKNPEIKKIYAIDLNPDAFKYLKENIKLNNVEEKIEAVQGDAVKLSKKHKEKADRVIMNLPKTSKNFFPAARRFLQEKGGILHFYTFAETKGEVKEEIQSSIRSNNYKILEIRKVRPYSPGYYNFAADIQIGKVNKQ